MAWNPEWDFNFKDLLLIYLIHEIFYSILKSMLFLSNF